jgi:hypothetical protein
MPFGWNSPSDTEPAHGKRSRLILDRRAEARCLNLSEQIAQKLHACTGPYSAGRAREVLDILLVELLGKLDVKAVKPAAEQVFAERDTHAFPPTVQLAAEWKPELEVLAKELGYLTTSAADIEARFRAFVESLAKA